MSVYIIKDDDYEKEELDEEEEVEVDLEVEEEEEDIDEDDEVEEEEEDIDEEDDIDVEVDVEVDVEDIDEEINDDVLLDDVLDDDNDNFELDLRDNIIEQSFNKQKKVKVQRYCKSLKELELRKNHDLQLNNYLFEKILSKYTSGHNAKKFTEISECNKDVLYQLCGKFMKKDYPFADLYKEIKNGIADWDSKTYSKEVEEETHELNIMTVKLTVSEGLYQCSKCKSKKTFSRQVQTRSADEGMTSIIQCSECNKVWREYA